MIPIACEITRPFKDKPNNFYMDVHVIENPILEAIINAKDKWHTAPVIWVGNFPYRIFIISHRKDQVELYQMALTKTTQSVINMRKVKITLATAL